MEADADKDRSERWFDRNDSFSYAYWPPSGLGRFFDQARNHGRLPHSTKAAWSPEKIGTVTIFVGELESRLNTLIQKWLLSLFFPSGIRGRVEAGLQRIPWATRRLNRTWRLAYTYTLTSKALWSAILAICPRRAADATRAKNLEHGAADDGHALEIGIARERGAFCETSISTIVIEAQAEPRFPGAHGNPGRAQHHQTPPGPRPETAVGISKRG
jgi:hypothetical protein